MCRAFISVYLCLIMAYKVSLSDGADSLSPGQFLTQGQSIVSRKGIFELGLIRTAKPEPNMYLGISYKDFGEQRVTVWVANRNNPLSESTSAKLELSATGNLVLSDTYTKLLLADMSRISTSVEAVLLDDGNFVLRQSSKPFTIYWQSFDDPTDTWLPGAKLSTKIRLTSWKTPGDPSPGLYSVKMNTRKNKEYELVMEWNMSTQYATSGIWKNKMFGLIPELNYLYGFRFVSNEKETYFYYSLLNPNTMSRLVLDVSGQLQQVTSLRSHPGWSVTFAHPREPSEVYAFCGPFGILNSSASCECLPGFQQLLSTENMGPSKFRDGCARIEPIKCGNSSSQMEKTDEFMKIKNVSIQGNSKVYPAQSVRACKKACTQNCSCVAYMFYNGECLAWENTLLDLKNLPDDRNKHDFYLKLAASGKQNRGKETVWWIVSAALASLVALISGGYIYHFRVHKDNEAGREDLSMDLQSYDFDSSSNTTNNERNRSNVITGGRKDVELPLFSFESVKAATSNFSEENKLGQGGFGPVYKGKTLNGQEIAVKRLSRKSGQGLEEFRNEIALISKLQHLNLVRLFGCCIEQDENILIYEYLPNKSLDFFLFDPSKQYLLTWDTRIRIIEGIAQGLLYLHQYSRVHIIHRDLKASNILLDSEMNPKISDFGLARIFSDNDSDDNTKRIAGTSGYMAPEYALEGHFSVKSDVFSFGVLLLEIVSGKKSTGFYNADSLNLLGHVWKLWNDDRAVMLLDPTISSPSSVATLERYINIGLLCVQGEPGDRPLMSKIVSMLASELVPLPTPNKPAFTTNHNMRSDAPTNSGGNYTINGLTVSRIEPR